MILVDSNVLIDIFNVDQEWRDWSQSMIQRLSDDGEELAINAVVLAEIASNFASLGDLLAMLDRLDVELLTLDEETAFAAGRAFRDYRRLHRSRDAMLSDFLIGGHAQRIAAPLLTRDLSLYRRYFPDLTLITPETHP